MKFINAYYEDFLKNRKNRKIIQFGASSVWNYYHKMFPDISSEVLDNTLFIVDNNPLKQGNNLEFDGRRISIKGVEELKKEDNYIILITVALAYHKSICEQLLGLNLPDNIECYSLPLMTYSFEEADNTCVSRYFKEHTIVVNKPIIHSFWFSGEEKPELYKKCVNSWHQYCPEFEIIEWTTENYDVTKNQYMKEAFEHRKWAFVSDYARLDVLYQYGGIYLDMDVELLAPLAPLLKADSFFCRQEDGALELGSGFGVQAGDSLIGELLDTYRERKLVMKDGQIDKTPQPEWISEDLKRHGILRSHDSQIVGNRLILSNDYISCSAGENCIPNAKLGIHWHNGGWLDEKDRKMLRDSSEAKDELIEKYFKL